MKNLIQEIEKSPELYIWLTVSWTLYFIIHSYLASNKVKRKLTQFGLSLRGQRLTYSTISSIGLLALLFFNGLIGGSPIIAKAEVVALFLGGAGVLIINAAFKQYSLRSFLGFEDESGSELKQSGILGYVRHPIYSGTILLVLGFFFYDPRLATGISALCIFIYLFVGITLEEKKLTKEFGQLYIDYKSRVPALVPNIFNLFKKIT